MKEYFAITSIAESDKATELKMILKWCSKSGIISESASIHNDTIALCTFTVTIKWSDVFKLYFTIDTSKLIPIHKGIQSH